MAEAASFQLPAGKNKPLTAQSDLSQLKLKGSTNNLRSSKFRALDAVIPKPEVWARIRPTPKFDDNVFQVDESGKHLCVKYDDPYAVKEGSAFPTDGILYNTGQDEMYHLIAHDLIEKALINGTSALFLILGPAQSGKKFTLFGPTGKYDHRGMIPRAVDHICNKMDQINSTKMYQLFISGVQICQNHINDLVTMTHYNIDAIGANGPCQKLAHEVYNRDEAGAVLHRIFAGSQKTKSSSTSHMFVYLDIFVVNMIEKAPIQRSRITFAKIASIPKRENLRRNVGRVRGSCIDHQGCNCVPSKIPFSIRSIVNPSTNEGKFPYEAIKCCRKKAEDLGNIGPQDIRRDLFFLEQLFVRANSLRRLSALKLKKPELVLKYMTKLHLTPSQFIRQSKLTHCLKDMCRVDTEIRVLIHVRPEGACIDTTIDALRFAERAKGIPNDAEYKKNRNRSKRRGKVIGSRQTSAIKFAQNSKLAEDESLMSTLLAEAEQAGTDVTVGLNPYQVRMIQQQLNQYFTEKLELKEVTVKPMKKQKKPRSALKTAEKEKQGDAVVTMTIEGVAVAASMTSRLSRAKATLQVTPNQAVSPENKIPTPPPTAVETAEFSSHPPTASEQHDSPKKSESGGESVKTAEREKSTDIIFKKEEDKEEKQRREEKQKSKKKKDDLRSRTEKPKRRKDGSLNDPNRLSSIQPPASAKEKRRRKKSTNAFPTPPHTAPLDSKRRKSFKKKEAAHLEMIEEDAPPTLSEIWASFIQSRAGFKSFMDFKKRLDYFSRLHFEQHNLLKYSKELLDKISPLQAELDEYKTNRFLKVRKKLERIRTVPVADMEKKLRYDVKVLQLARDPLLVRLRNMKQQMTSQDTSLETYRKACESSFLLFSLHHFGVLFPVEEIPINCGEYKFDPTSVITPVKSPESDKFHKSGKLKRNKSSPAIVAMFNMRRKTKSLPDELIDSLHSKQYENITRVGKVQCAILKKLNYRRPTWVKYY